MVQLDRSMGRDFDEHVVKMGVLSADAINN
jgi:hypothetical protein